MNKKSLIIPAVLSAGMATESALAQEDSQQIAEEEVISIGTRIQGRSATESVAPVDVVSGDDFINQGDADLSSLLRNVVPSYNVNSQPISDAATIVRPANLRGLPPDSTLLLLNGKRRHRAAVISFLGGGISDGAQGADISAIPAIALEQVEVLRDGAAAQYGSDAIAGVINLKLKDATEGFTLDTKLGSTYEGDGDLMQVAANIGMPFSENGFANLSMEYRETDPTSRSVQRDDAAGLIAAGNPNVADPAQIWGTPEVQSDFKGVLNLGLDLGGGKEFYAFGNYAERTVEGGFYFRNPDTRPGVFGVALDHVDTDGNTVVDSLGNTVPLHYDTDSGALIPLADMLDADGALLPSLPGNRRYDRLVADLTPDGSGNCPQTGADNTGGLDVRDADGLAAVFADDNCFVFNEIFPGGFTPRFGGDLNDLGGYMGVRGEMNSGLVYDVSIGAGRSQIDFFIRNTVNATLGDKTPTEFRPGTYVQLERNFNVDFAYPIELSSGVFNLASGFEWREEQFEARIGDVASFEVGPLVGQGFSIGSNGFPGFSPQVAGEFARENIALYADAEADFDWLVLGTALRWEDFSDFGSTSNYKVSGRLNVSENVAFRTTLSTGFRAPTPGQSNVTNVSTVFEGGALINRGTIPPTNPIALVKGGEQLQPEESESISFGGVFNVAGVDITVDFFSINLDDRITQSASQSLTDDERAALVDAGITGAESLTAFRFYTNDFETQTEGVDIVATYPFELGGGDSTLSFAFNNTQTEVKDFNPEVLDATRIRQIEESLPETRANIAWSHNDGPLRGLLRVNYFGEYYEAHLDDGTLPIEASAEYTVDIEGAYTFADKYTVTIGAENLLDEYPDEHEFGGIAGAKYPVTSPMGFNGGFYYLKFRYEI